MSVEKPDMEIPVGYGDVMPDMEPVDRSEGGHEIPGPVMDVDVDEELERQKEKDEERQRREEEERHKRPN
jgi:hypothetical protein